MLDGILFSTLSGSILNNPSLEAYYLQSGKDVITNRGLYTGWSFLPQNAHSPAEIFKNKLTKQHENRVVLQKEWRALSKCPTVAPDVHLTRLDKCLLRRLPSLPLPGGRGHPSPASHSGLVPLSPK